MSIARDVAIIILAVESIVIGVLLSVLVIQVIRLVKMLRHEVLPILNSTQETVSTVKGTASFVSDHMVQPVVRVASYTAGARQAVSTLFGGRKRNGRERDKKEVQENE